MKTIFLKTHLLLSVPFGIFITLICFSGAMLVFEKEITERRRHDLYFVKEAKEKPLPVDSLMRLVASTLPDSVTVTGVTISPDAERTRQVSLSKPRRASLYVDPYTGEVAGRNERLPFYDTMFHLHRWVLGSSTGFGKLLVGVSTSMLVIILVTGILMWLTNRKKPLGKSLAISFTEGWPRFWHDLHVAGGIYATVFLLAIALTGLTWSFSWYRTGFYGMFGVEASAAGHGSHGGDSRLSPTETRKTAAEEERVDYQRHRTQTASDTSVPSHIRDGKGRRSGKARKGISAGQRTENAEINHGDRRTKQEDSITKLPRLLPFVHWQDVYERLSEAYPDYLQITISDGSASVVPSGRYSLRSGDRFDFDAASGAITGSTPYAAQDKSARVRSAVYTVHVGSWGGFLTRIVTFFAAILGATLPPDRLLLVDKKIKE